MTCNICKTNTSADDIRYSGMCVDCYQKDCEPMEKEMTLTRKTFWSNGLITTREMSFAIEDWQEFVDGQQRRINNGPGIDRVQLIDGRGRCYMILTVLDI